jgi:hypothetical protein
MSSRFDQYLSEVDEVISRKYQKPGLFARIMQFLRKATGRGEFEKPLSVQRT